MKTLILYLSKHGTCEKMAFRLAEKLSWQGIDIIDLAHHIPKIDSYDNIIIGASIHMGKIHKKTSKFCDKNKDILLAKNLAIFLTSREKGEIGIQQYENSFNETLRQHASTYVLLGYELLFDKMNIIEKVLMKKIVGTTETISEINYSAFDDFVHKLKNEWK